MHPEGTGSIESVQRFWDENPLWTGESRFEPGSREFFEEHRATVIQDGFAGELDRRLFPPGMSQLEVLDLGCGIGFWLVEFGERGCKRLAGADLSMRSVALARRRCELFGIQAEVLQGNAESLPFPDASFDHVNCQGVLHHTPDPRAGMREVHRILRPGGTFNVSLYYKNFFLRHWHQLGWLVNLLGRAGLTLRGRGREGFLQVGDANELVRLYDGADNPIGRCYTRAEMRQLVEPEFAVLEWFRHFFPARILPLPLPRPLHRWLDGRIGLLLHARLIKTA